MKNTNYRVDLPWAICSGLHLSKQVPGFTFLTNI